MDFGYFTLSDNHYASNPRSANQFVADIVTESLLAEDRGLDSSGSEAFPARMLCSTS